MNARDILLSKFQFDGHEQIVDELAKYVVPMRQSEHVSLEDSTTLREISVEYIPGKGLVAKSRRLSNVQINWRKMLLEGIPTLVLLGIEFVASPTRGVFSALLAYQAWTGIFEIELSEKHAEVVKYLWIERQASNRVITSEIEEAFSNHPDYDIPLLLSDLAVLGLLELDDHGGVIRKDVIVQ